MHGRFAPLTAGMNPIVDFFTVDGQIQWRFDAQLHSFSFHRNDGDCDALAQHDSFPWFSAENQHDASLLVIRKSRLAIFMPVIIGNIADWPVRRKTN
jgi:hypothetical protein